MVKKKFSLTDDLKGTILERGAGSFQETIEKSEVFLAKDKVLVSKHQTLSIPLEKIKTEKNIRSNFSEINELAFSILTNGQIQPIGVFENENGTYTVIFGHRRFEAFKLISERNKISLEEDFIEVTEELKLKLAKIDAIVFPKPKDDASRIVIQISENEQRTKISLLDFAENIETLSKIHKLNNTQIAKMLGKQRPRIAEALAIAKIKQNLAVWDKLKAIESIGFSKGVQACTPEQNQPQEIGFLPLLAIARSKNEEEQNKKFWQFFGKFCSEKEKTELKIETKEKKQFQKILKVQKVLAALVKELEELKTETKEEVQFQKILKPSQSLLNNLASYQKKLSMINK